MKEHWNKEMKEAYQQNLDKLRLEKELNEIIKLKSLEKRIEDLEEFRMWVETQIYR